MIELQCCVYCGATEDLTDEHAPPKLIFAKPRPNDLITVRACEKCNREGQADAEYFRICLCLSEKTASQSGVQALTSPVQRSLQRAEAKGFRAALLSNLAFDGHGFEFTTDIGRIHRVVARTVQCLYLREIGERLPDAHQVTVVGEDFLQQFSSEKAEDFRQTFIPELLKEMPRMVGGRLFSYTFFRTVRKGVTVWGLVFFNAMPFIVLTGRPREHP